MKHRFAALLNAAPVLLAALLLALCPCALAQGATYVFSYEGFRYTQGDAETVLTQTNLAQHEELIESLGTTKEAILASYIASGIVMEVLPDGGGQIAVSVADAGAFADVDDMDALSAEQLAAFAAQFADSGLYESCEIADTDPLCVRLTSSAMYGSMPVYTLRYATLHLGRLYMLTQTVVGRAPEAEDDEQLIRVLSSIELLSMRNDPTPEPTSAPTPAPTATPVPTPGIAEILSQAGDLTVEGVPAFTNASEIAITGKAAPSTEVRASVGDRSLGRVKSAEDGSYALNVTLPDPGDLTLTVTAGEDEQSLAVHYELPYAKLTITEPLETTFTGNYVMVRGETEPDATVYVTGKGNNVNVHANRNGAFSVRIFINDPETLTFTLRTKLRGYQETTLDLTLTRELTEKESIALFRQQMVDVPYATLAGDPAAYQDRKFIFRGRIVEFADYDGKPCALILVNNVSTGVWRDPLWVVLTGEERLAGDDGEMELAIDDIITFYLEGEGTTLRTGGEYTQDGEATDAPVTRALYITSNR